MIFRIVVAAATLTGCGLAGYPDRRDSEVMVNESESHDPTLWEDVAFSLRLWNRATGDTSAEIVSHCSYDRACTIVSFGMLSGKRYGQTKRWYNPVNGHAGADVVIMPDLGPEMQLITVAHEIGHSFTLYHVDDENDIMYPWRELTATCIGEASLNEWRDIFVNTGPMTKTCIDDP